MPIYEYTCNVCGGVFEKIILTDKTVIKCPKCGGNGTKKFSLFSAHYKGPGFYTTEQRGITGKQRKPNIKVGDVSDLKDE